jgi:hypothetical protein
VLEIAGLERVLSIDMTVEGARTSVRDPSEEPEVPDG